MTSSDGAPGGEDRRRFLVHGHVQGVGFRWWTRSLGTRLGLSGSVRNLADGTVEVRASGDEAALGRLRDALHRGPDGASVQRVDESRDDGPAPEGFRIVR